MWLVVAFQLFYSADCQWFEVCLPFVITLSLCTVPHLDSDGAKLTLELDIHVDADGHYY